MHPTPQTLVLAALVVLAASVGLLLAVQRTRLSRKSVFAWLPWFGTGAALHALHGAVGYPDLVRPLLGSPWVYLLAASVAGIAWTLLTQLTSSEKGRAAVTRYFGVMGLGTLLPPVVLLIVQRGITSPTRLVLWVAVPVVSVVVTYCLLLSLGLWLPNPAYFAGFAGGIVIFGAAVEAITTAVALGVGGQPATPVVLTLTTRLADLGGLAVPVALVAVAVWLRLAVGVAVVVGLELLDRSHPVLAERGLKAATVGSLVVAANTFMLALAGGWLA
ncbi:MAG: hypothetical protein ABEJ06_00350 [Haloarculaceae archaeon]